MMCTVSAETSRGDGVRRPSGRRTERAPAKSGKDAYRPRHSCSEPHGGARDDARGAVVVDVPLGLVAFDVDELPAGCGGHDIEGDDETAVVGAVRDRAGAPGSAAEEAADAGVHGRGVHPQLPPGGTRGLFEGGHGRPGVGGDGLVGHPDDRARPGHVQHQPAGHGDGLPVVARPLAARGDRRAVPYRESDDRRDLLRGGREGDEVGDAERKLLGDDRRHAGAVDGCLLTLAHVGADAAGTEQVGEISFERGIVGGGHGCPPSSHLPKAVRGEPGDESLVAQGAW